MLTYNLSYPRQRQVCYKYHTIDTYTINMKLLMIQNMDESRMVMRKTSLNIVLCFDICRKLPQQIKRRLTHCIVVTSCGSWSTFVKCQAIIWTNVKLLSIWPIGTSFVELLNEIQTLHSIYLKMSLHWRHNGPDSASNHQPHDCLLNRLFRRRSTKTSKLRVTGLCCGEFAWDRWIPLTDGQ